MRPALVVVMAGVLAVMASTPIRAQDRDSRCGALCLYIALTGLDFHVDSYLEFERALGPPTNRGYSFIDLEIAAQKQGAHTLALQTSLDALRERRDRFGCIAHMYLNDGVEHYVLVTDVSEREVTLINFPHDAQTIPRETFESQWSGKVLLISRDPIRPVVIPWHRTWLRILRRHAVGFGIAAAGLVIGFAAFVSWHRRHVKRVAQVVLLVSSVGLLLGCHRSENARPPSGPRLLVVTTVQAGEVLMDEGVPVVLSVPIANAGDSDLAILGVSSGCGCTVVCLNWDSVPPGESRILPITLAPPSLGPGRARLELTSNDRTQPNAAIAVEWNAVASLEVIPAMLDLGACRPGPVSRELVFRARRSDAPPTIKTFEASRPELFNPETDWRNLQLDDRGTPLRFTWNIPRSAGEHHAILKVTVDGDHVRTFSIPIRWELLEPISVVPRRIFIDFPRDQVVASARVVISSNGTPLVIDGIELLAQTDGESAKLSTFSATKAVIDVRIVRPVENVASIDRRLVLRIQSPENVVIEVPIHARMPYLRKS